MNKIPNTEELLEAVANARKQLENKIHEVQSKFSKVYQQNAELMTLLVMFIHVILDKHEIQHTIGFDKENGQFTFEFESISAAVHAYETVSRALGEELLDFSMQNEMYAKYGLRLHTIRFEANGWIISLKTSSSCENCNKSEEEEE